MKSERVEVFSGVPTDCESVGKAAGSALRVFGGSLFDPNAHLDSMLPASDFRLTCVLTFDDPIPAVGTPADSPISRSVIITTSVNEVLPWLRSGKPLIEDPDLRREAASPPETLPGVGQDSVVWTRVAEDAEVSVRSRTTVDNLDIYIDTWGLNWQGTNEFPVSDSSRLRADLRSAVDALTSSLAETLPTQLPRSSIEVGTPLPSRAPSASPAQSPAIELWDPCTLAGAPAEAAGLPSTPIETIANSSLRRCTWQTDDYFLEVASSPDTVENSFFTEQYRAPNPVTIAGRDALRLLWRDGHYQCVLAFDTPFGAQNGRKVGVTRFEISKRDSSPQPLETTCAALTAIVESFTPHLPPRGADRLCVCLASYTSVYQAMAGSVRSGA
nr:DUF3558 domain-containing protein [Micromonospora sp. NBC_00855]